MNLFNKQFGESSLTAQCSPLLTGSILLWTTPGTISIEIFKTWKDFVVFNLIDQLGYGTMVDVKFIVYQKGLANT